MKSTIRLVKSEDLVHEVLCSSRPVLVLCMPRDDQFFHQLKILEEAAVEQGNAIKAVVLQEDLIGVFKQRYCFTGTPTFLLLAGGKEMGRLLGLANREALADLISHAIEASGSLFDHDNRLRAIET